MSMVPFVRGVGGNSVVRVAVRVTDGVVLFPVRQTVNIARILAYLTVVIMVIAKVVDCVYPAFYVNTVNEKDELLDPSMCYKAVSTIKSGMELLNRIESVVLSCLNHLDSCPVFLENMCKVTQELMSRLPARYMYQFAVYIVGACLNLVERHACSEFASYTQVINGQVVTVAPRNVDVRSLQLEHSVNSGISSSISNKIAAFNDIQREKFTQLVNYVILVRRKLAARLASDPHNINPKSDVFPNATVTKEGVYLYLTKIVAVAGFTQEDATSILNNCVSIAPDKFFSTLKSTMYKTMVTSEEATEIYNACVANSSPIKQNFTLSSDSSARFAGNFSKQKLGRQESELVVYCANRNIPNTDLTQLTLDDLDLSNGHFAGSKFPRLAGTRFNGANLTGATLSSELINVSFGPDDGRSTVLNQANIGPTNHYGVRGCDFTNASLFAAKINLSKDQYKLNQWSGAKLSVKSGGETQFCGITAEHLVNNYGCAMYDEL